MTTARTMTKAGWWRLLLAAIAALVVGLLGAGTASAATPTVAETRVGASPAAGQVVVGIHESIAAGQRWGNAPPEAETVAGSCVAAKAVPEAGMAKMAFGPGSEKAWTVLNRVDAKGAPLPGYKGGSVFKNSQGKLPEGPTYREWDVNPYTKGVNRGAERVVTGSDGSAYWTGDHYDSFLMFRGPTG